MVVDAVANRAHALISDWRAGDKEAAGKLLSLLGATAPHAPHVPAGDRAPLPAWASRMADVRHLLGCDASQTLCAIAVNGGWGWPSLTQGLTAQ